MRIPRVSRSRWSSRRQERWMLNQAARLRSTQTPCQLQVTVDIRSTTPASTALWSMINHKARIWLQAVRLVALGRLWRGMQFVAQAHAIKKMTHPTRTRARQPSFFRRLAACFIRCAIADGAAKAFGCGPEKRSRVFKMRSEVLVWGPTIFRLSQPAQLLRPILSQHCSCRRPCGAGLEDVLGAHRRDATAQVRG